MKLRFILFLILILSFWVRVNGQNETNIWYFGENAGLDFNMGLPVPLLDGALVTDEGCATIANGQGELLFYTDGVAVYNRNHQVMFCESLILRKHLLELYP